MKPASPESAAGECRQSVAARAGAAPFWLYKNLVSPVLHFAGVGQCLYRPTCSEYAYVAVVRFGPFHGSWMALRRLLRCHPWAHGGFDPVPERSNLRRGDGCDHLP